MNNDDIHNHSVSEDNSKYKPSDNVYVMSVKNGIWGITGLIIGILVNNFIILISNVFKIHNLFTQNMIQISVCSIVISGIQHYNNYFGWSWQNITPGLFFVSFFFGTQFKILNNVANLHMIKDLTV